MGERALIRQVRALAQRTHRDIGEAALGLDDCQGIARLYGIILR